MHEAQGAVLSSGLVFLGPFLATCLVWVPFIFSFFIFLALSHGCCYFRLGRSFVSIG